MENKVSPLSRAPAFAVLLGLCSTLFAGSLGCSIYVSLFVSLFVCMGWILFGTQQSVKYWRSVFVLALIFTLLFSFVSLLRINKKYNFPSTIDCFATVTQKRSWGEKNCALLISSDYAKVVTYMPNNEDIQPGTKLHINAATFDFKKASQKGAFDEEYFWKAKGAKKKAVLLKFEKIGEPKGFYRWRNFLEKRIKERLPQRCADYMLAITLGEKSRELSKLHQSSGTSHLLAVSGFHVGILAAAIYIFLRRSKHRIWLTSIIVWGYVFLSGCAPGAIRAAFMLQLALLSLCIGTPISSFNSVSVAGIVLLLFNPYSFFDLGFRLSMLAALFITSCSGSYGMITASLISMLVWFVTAAQSAFSFKQLPMAGLFMNIIAVPVFGLLFPLLICCSIPALMGLPFGNFLSGFSEYLLEGWELFARLATSFIPQKIGYSTVMTAVSAFLFFYFAAMASGYPKNKRIFIAIFSSIFLVLSV